MHSQNSIALPHLNLQIRKPSLDPMLNLFFNTIFSSLRSRQSLVLENMGLRHQLVVLRRNNKTPRLRSRDRFLWVILSQIHVQWLQEILSNLGAVVDAVPTPQKKHLLHLLVKKALIRDKHTFEVWCRLPQFPGVRTLSKLAAPRGLCANRIGLTGDGPYRSVIFRFRQPCPFLTQFAYSDLELENNIS